MANTVRLHRVLRSSTERVYRAFLDPAALCKWLPPFGFTATLHQSDLREGGGYHMSFTNFTNGKSQSFKSSYFELKPNESLRYSSQFDDPQMPGKMEVTVALKKVICGTEIQIVQANIPPEVPVEICYLGWQESLLQLAQLVEPEIPG